MNLEKVVQNLKNKKKIVKLIIILLILLTAIVIIFATQKKEKLDIAQNIKALGEIEQQLAVPDGYIGIYTEEDLKNIASNLSANYILMSDIDMADEEWTPLGISSSVPFTGILDGNLYKISNLKIESNNQYVGMFGYTNGATIKNLTLENVTVTSSYTTTSSAASYESYVGGLVGYRNGGSISNVKVSGKVSHIEEVAANIYIGGVIGYSTGTLDNIENNANVEDITDSIKYIGGVVGYQYYNGKITNSSNKGNINTSTKTKNMNVGGITGYACETISMCYSDAIINVDTETGYMSVGGVVGYQNNGTVEKSYAKGNIIVNGTSASNTTIGGLIGHSYGGYIKNTYSTTNIQGNLENGNVGGLVGYNYNGSYLSNSYAVGKIEIEGANIVKGGLIGSLRILK